MYNTQRLNFDYETSGHLRFSVGLKTERMDPIGNIAFMPLGSSVADVESSLPASAVGSLSSIRTTEATFGLRLAPKEKFFNTKQRRRTLNKDAWFVSLQHTMGMKNVLGGDYWSNFTELEFYRRTWLPMSWGKFDVRLKAGTQWNQVPYPLLIMPQANLSYVLDYSAFSMINNMEFLSDRYASLMLTWEMGGKLLNRIPLLRKLNTSVEKVEVA